KILMIRLNNLLTRLNILQWNNRAGTKGYSTLEPLTIIKHFLEQRRIAKDHHIWLAIQDLSKAYDRVNLSLLKLALKRIHIPFFITNLFISLFTDRSNSVIIKNDLSNPYPVLQGIDQGETIAPLLW